MFKPHPFLQQPTKVGSVAQKPLTFGISTKRMLLSRLATDYPLEGTIMSAAIALMVVAFSALPVRANDYRVVSLTPGTTSLLETKSATEWVKQGLALAETNELDGAIAAFNRAIALKLDYADAYYNRGTAYAKIGNARAAIADYSQVILLKPNSAAARYSRGSLRAAIGNKEEAIADFQQAATLFKQQLNLPWQQKALDSVKVLQQP